METTPQIRYFTTTSADGDVSVYKVQTVYAVERVQVTSGLTGDTVGLSPSPLSQSLYDNMGACMEHMEWSSRDGEIQEIPAGEVDSILVKE